MKSDTNFVKFFHFLTWAVDEYGVYLFMGFVVFLPFLVVWIFRWARKHPRASIPVGTSPLGAPPPRDPYKKPLGFDGEDYDTWL